MIGPIALDEHGPAYSIGDPGIAASRVVPKPDERHWHRPDTVLDGVVIAGADRLPALDLRAASVRGLAHREYGRVRQDSYAFRVTSDHRYLLVGVADGVGAGSLSHVAADIAMIEGTRLLSEMLAGAEPDRLPWDRLFAELAGMIIKAGRSWLPRDGATTEREIASWMATTALFGVIELNRENDEYPVHLVRVGDCSAWLLRADGSWAPQQAIKNADEEIHTSATAALPVIGGALPPPVRTALRPGEALVLMSDGVGDPLVDGAGEVGRVLSGAWQRPPRDVDFAAQVGFAKRTYDDDRTVVAVWPR